MRNARTGMSRPKYPPPPPADELLAARRRQAERCQAGDHDVAVAEEGRVVYDASNRRRKAGERYCRACGDLIAEAEAEASS